MRNIIKKLLVLIPLMGVLTGCGTPKGEDSSQEEDIKVEEIYFDLLSDKIYVNHYAQITDFEVLPYSASNKNVSWTFEDPTLGEVIGDKAYGYKAGVTNIICEATDGSNVSYSRPIEILDLLEPSIIEVKQTAYVTLGSDYVPEVTFYPNVSSTDQRFILEIPEEYSEYASVNGNKVETLKPGLVKVKVISASNPSLYKQVDLHIEEDLIASSTVEPEYVNAAKIYEEYEGRNTVLVGTYKATETPTWPDFKIKLPKPINLSKQNGSIDIKQISGPNWACIKFLDINKKSILKTETGRDYEQGMNSNSGNWTTVPLVANSAFTKDIYYIQIHLYAISSDTVNGQTIYLGDYATFAFDNLVVNEIPLEGFELPSNNIQIDLETPYEIKPVFLPSDTTVKTFSLRLEEGSEQYIEILEGNKIKGRALGQGVVYIYSPGYESATYRLEVEVVEKIPHLGAIQLLANKDNEVQLTNPFSALELFSKAIAFDFKLENKDGCIGFTIVDEEFQDWYNITDTIRISKSGNDITSNMGKISQSEIPDWYTITINENELHGDGRGKATTFDLVYAPGGENTINSWVDFDSLRVVDAHERDNSKITKYSNGQSINHDGWYRYTIAKLSVSSFAFDFKMDEVGSLTYSIYDVAHGSIEIIKDITLTCDGNNVTSNRGRIISHGDSWYTLVLSYNEFNGETVTTGHIDTFISKSLTGSISIDWSSMRLCR